MLFLSFAPDKANKISPMHLNFPWWAGIGSCCGEQLVECWMKAWMFFWDVFIGPLVKGSNRYQDVRAGFCHDTSAIRHEEASFLPIMGRVRYVRGKQSEMGTSVVRIKLKELVGNQQNVHSKCWAIRERGGRDWRKWKAFIALEPLEREISIFEWQFVGSQGYLLLPGWGAWIQHLSALCWRLLDWFNPPAMVTYKRRPHAFTILLASSEDMCVLSPELTQEQT